MKLEESLKTKKDNDEFTLKVRVAKAKPQFGLVCSINKIFGKPDSTIRYKSYKRTTITQLNFSRFCCLTENKIMTAVFSCVVLMQKYTSHYNAT